MSSAAGCIPSSALRDPSPSRSIGKRSATTPEAMSIRKLESVCTRPKADPTAGRAIPTRKESSRDPATSIASRLYRYVCAAEAKRRESENA